MTVDQSLQLIESLAAAARVAVQNGWATVDLLPALQHADDVARDELAKAIEDASNRLTAAE